MQFFPPNLESFTCKIIIKYTKLNEIMYLILYAFHSLFHLIFIYYFLMFLFTKMFFLLTVCFSIYSTIFYISYHILYILLYSIYWLVLNLLMAIQLSIAVANSSKMTFSIIISTIKKKTLSLERYRNWYEICPDQSSTKV